MDFVFSRAIIAAVKFSASNHSGSWPRLSPEHFSLLEEHEGDPLNAVLHGQCLVSVDIYFQD